VKKATYYYYQGLEKTELEVADSVMVETENGVGVELQFRRSDGEISVSVSTGRMVIVPVASNVIRIEIRR
jgi:hypothetical protein